MNQFTTKIGTALFALAVITLSMPGLGLTIIALLVFGYVVVCIGATVKAAYHRPVVVRMRPKVVDGPAAPLAVPAVKDPSKAEQAAELRTKYRRNIDIIKAMPLPKDEKRALREEARTQLIERLAEILR